MSISPDPHTGLFDTRRLAAFLKIKPSTLRSRKFRNQLPPPLSDDINGGPVWHPETISNFFSIQKDSPVKIPAPNSALPSAIDLFAGCGGLSLGFQHARFEILAGFDNWQPAIETYNRNLNHSCYNLDLGDVQQTIDTIGPFMNGRTGIIGGPPCQDFSSAGKREEGERADLTEKFAQVVTEFMPPFFLMENVERAKNSAAFGRAVQHLEAHGFTVTKHVLDASLCGAPQKRKRLITFGHRNPEVVATYEENIKSNLASKPMTVRDYFGDRLDIEFYYRHPRSYARRGIFSIDEPSATIRGVNRPIPGGYVPHPGDAGPVEKSRPLTTQERAEIQTFPPEFILPPVKTTAEQMIGNAVPVALGKYLARAISDALLAHPEKHTSPEKGSTNYSSEQLEFIL